MVVEYPLQVRSAFFTIFGDYIRKDNGMITMPELIKLFSALEFSEEAIKAAIFRMRHQQIVLSKRQDGVTYYSLSEEGIEKMDEGLRRTFREVDTINWDGWWRVLVYSIPEKNRQLRDQLRKELAWHGFGQLTPGTWITPYNLFEPIKRVIKTYQMENFIQMFESKHIGPGSNQSLVEQAWDMDSINLKYTEFINKYKPRYQTYLQEKEQWDDHRTFAERVQLVHEYRMFLHIDPELPIELLHANWVGEEARHLFRKYYGVLTAGAVSFYKYVRKDSK